MLCASGALLFTLTVLRFRAPRHNYFYLLASLSVTVATAGSYHLASGMYRFTLYWCAYNAAGAAVAWVAATLVLPVTAGAELGWGRGQCKRVFRMRRALWVAHAVWCQYPVQLAQLDHRLARLHHLVFICPLRMHPAPLYVPTGATVRASLAAALRGEGLLLQAAVRLLTGELTQEGLLAAASGVVLESSGVDSGLWPAVGELHREAETASGQIQVGWPWSLSL